MKPHVSLPYKDGSSKYSLGISTPLNVIDQKLKVIDLEAGMNTIISVTPQFIETSEGFNGLHAISRKCRLPNETFGLNLVKNYSRTACENECVFMKAVTDCKCTPWYYRNNITTVPICDMFGGYCFNKIMSTRKFYKRCPNCLEDCNGVQLSWEKTFRPLNVEIICRRGSMLHEYLLKSTKQHFSHDHYIRLTTGDKEKIAQQFIYLDNTMKNGNESDHYVTLCKDFVKKYVAIVTVETPTDEITKTLRDLKVTWMDKIGIIGGTLGLFTGVSMISIIPIITKIYKMIGGCKNENKDEKCEEQGFSDTGDFF